MCPCEITHEKQSRLFRLLKQTLKLLNLFANHQGSNRKKEASLVDVLLLILYVVEVLIEHI